VPAVTVAAAQKRSCTRIMIIMIMAAPEVAPWLHLPVTVQVFGPLLVHQLVTGNLPVKLPQ
jgi:hypothetical protein